MQKTCPICNRQFNAHPNATYCDLTCANRAAYRRRSARRLRNATPPPASPYQAVLDNISTEALAKTYLDVQTHVYSRDIRINGPLPPNVPKPSDICLLDAGDHYLVYHASRPELLLG